MPVTSGKAAREFLVNPNTLTYDEIAFTPATTPITTINYWVPSSVELIEEYWSVTVNLLFNIICDSDRDLFC